MALGKCISTLDIAVGAINAANAAIRDAVILPDAAQAGTAIKATAIDIGMAA